MPAEWVQFQRLLHQQRQAVEAATHVGCAQRQVDAHARRHGNQAPHSKTARKSCRALASIPGVDAHAAAVGQDNLDRVADRRIRGVGCHAGHRLGGCGRHVHGCKRRRGHDLLRRIVRQQVVAVPDTGGKLFSPAADDAGRQPGHPGEPLDRHPRAQCVDDDLLPLLRRPGPAEARVGEQVHQLSTVRKAVKGELKNSLAPPLASPPCGSRSAATTRAAPASRARHFLKVLGVMPWRSQ